MHYLWFWLIPCDSACDIFLDSQTSSTSKNSGTTKAQDRKIIGSKYLINRSWRLRLLSISWWCTSGYFIAIYLSCDSPTVIRIEALNAPLYINLTTLVKTAKTLDRNLWYLNDRLKNRCDPRNVVSKEYKAMSKKLNVFFIDFVVNKMCMAMILIKIPTAEISTNR